MPRVKLGLVIFKLWEGALNPSARVGRMPHLLLVAQWCLTLCDPMDCSPQAPRSMEFFRQETGVGSHSLPGDLPNPGIEPGSPVLQADSLPSELPGKTKELPNEGRAKSRLP